MSGKLCAGYPRDNSGAAKLRDSKAYCEGMLARARDFVWESNPHLNLSSAWDSWGAGWDDADDNAGGVMNKEDSGCCATMGAIVA